MESAVFTGMADTEDGGHTVGGHTVGGHTGPPLQKPADKDGNGIGGIYGDGGTGIESQGLLLNDPSSNC